MMLKLIIKIDEEKRIRCGKFISRRLITVSTDGKIVNIS